MHVNLEYNLSFFDHIRRVDVDTQGRAMIRKIIGMIFLLTAILLLSEIVVYCLQRDYVNAQNLYFLAIALLVAAFFGAATAVRSLRSWIETNGRGILFTGITTLAGGCVWVATIFWLVMSSQAETVPPLPLLIRMGGFWLIFVGAMISILPTYIFLFLQLTNKR